jgi:cell fate regulator YaaT (PSP1 superfamily)
MPDIVGVRFKRAGKIYYFDPATVNLKVYDYVVVQTARGAELGQVAISPKQVVSAEVTTELKPIVRKASPEDVKQAQDFAGKEDTAVQECSKMITKQNLKMKLVSAEYNLDGSRLTFYFTADERVDFRELVRELTGFFRTRIELRQIGPRDQAKIVGGQGRCGRGLCCGSFLSEFNPVSIKMAKEQDLPLDPMKISGICGRLQCCLAYESNQYHEAKAQMPRKGQMVSTPSGPGMVVGVYPLKDSVIVELESKADVEVPVKDVKIIAEPARPEPAAEPVAEIGEAEEPEESETLVAEANLAAIAQPKPAGTPVPPSAPENETKPVTTPFPPVTPANETKPTGDTEVKPSSIIPPP